MIKATDIYAATRDGLDIILYYYPQAEGCVPQEVSGLLQGYRFWRCRLGHEPDRHLYARRKCALP